MRPQPITMSSDDDEPHGRRGTAARSSDSDRDGSSSLSLQDEEDELIIAHRQHIDAMMELMKHEMWTSQWCPSTCTATTWTGTIGNRPPAVRDADYLLRYCVSSSSFMIGHEPH
jgi:hypothetical protein